MSGSIDVTAAIHAAFRAGRVMSVAQRGWTVIIRLMSDHAVGPLRMSELDALRSALDLAPGCLTLLEAGRGVVEVQLDLDYQAPSRLDAGADAWFAD